MLILFGRSTQKVEEGVEGKDRSGDTGAKACFPFEGEVHMAGRKVTAAMQAVEDGMNIQSCTSRETLELDRMLVVFREDGLVVMTMTGEELYGEEGR